VQLGDVERDVAGHGLQIGLQTRLGNGGTHGRFQRPALVAVVQAVRADHDRRGRSVRRHQQPGREAILNHALSPAGGVATVKPPGVDQRLDGEAIFGGRDVVGGGRRQHALDSRQRFEPRDQLMQLVQRGGLPQVVAREQGDQDLIFRKLPPQLAIELHGRRVDRKIRLRRVVELEAWQRGER
jgi:hypothetical protein